MTAQPYRSTVHDPRDPVLHDLSPLRLADRHITLQLSMRRSEDGVWWGRLRFIDDGGREYETAEIVRGGSEEEFWQAVRGLSEHHVRALYLSLV